MEPAIVIPAAVSVLLLLGMFAAALIIPDKVRALPMAARLLIMGALISGVAAFAFYATKHDSETEAVWSPKAIIWSHVPLTVSWDHKGLATYNGAFDDAIMVWDRATSCALLEPAKGDEEGDIRITQDTLEPCGHLGVEVVGKGDSAGTAICGGRYAEIYIPELDDILIAHRIVAHELGHALGLDHDRPGESIMEPAIVPSDPRPKLPSVKDVRALRLRYCP